MIFRLALRLAWLTVPGDWCWFEMHTLERSIHDCVRRAVIDLDRLPEVKRFKLWKERIAALEKKGTKG